MTEIELSSFGDFRLGDWVIQPRLSRIIRGDSTVTLELKMMDVLVCLAAHEGELVDRQTLVDVVWATEFISENTLTRAIAELRAAIGDDAKNPKYIETIHRRGYRLVATVEMLDGTYDRTRNQRSMRMFGWPHILLLATAFVTGALLISHFFPMANVPTEVAAVYRQVTFSGEVGFSSLSTDGQWVAYAEQTDHKNRRVLVQDLAGGKPVEILDSLTLIGSLQWSPNGNRLLISAAMGDHHGSYIVPRLGGAYRSLPYIPNVDWSPDGSRYAGTWQGGDNRIHIFDIVTEEVTHIAFDETAQVFFTIDWSPAERILVQTATNDMSKTCIWTVLPDGSEMRQVMEADFGAISSPRWSASGEAIYYLLDRGRDKNDLMRIDLDTTTGITTKGPITVIAGFDGYSISLSGDQTRILYTQNVYDSDLWVFEMPERAASGDVRQVQLTSGRQVDSSPSLSPDGTIVAFLRRAGGDADQILTIPFDGGEPQQITFLEKRAFCPVWSPDSSEIAFISEDDGIQKVWAVSSSGGIPRVFSGTMASCSLTWAPASRLVYQRPDNRNLHVLDPDTDEEARLIVDDSVGWGFEPRYSPDGSEVALFWNRAYEGDFFGGVWKVSTTDGTAQLLARERAYPLEWSIDGEWVYAEDEENRLVRISASGGDPEILLKVPFEEASIRDITPNGRRMVVTVSEGFSNLWIVDSFDPYKN